MNYSNQLRLLREKIFRDYPEFDGSILLEVEYMNPILQRLEQTPLAPIIQRVLKSNNEDELWQNLFEAGVGTVLIDRFGEQYVEYEPQPTEVQQATPRRSPDFRVQIGESIVDLEVKYVSDIKNRKAVYLLRRRITNKEFSDDLPPYDLILNYEPGFEPRHVDGFLKHVAERVKNLDVTRVCKSGGHYAPTETMERVVTYRLTRSRDRTSGIALCCWAESPVALEAVRMKLKDKMDEAHSQFMKEPSDKQFNLVLINMGMLFGVNQRIMCDALYDDAAGLFAREGYQKISGLIWAEHFPKLLGMDLPSYLYPNPVSIANGNLQHLPLLFRGTPLYVLRGWDSKLLPPDSEYPRMACNERYPDSSKGMA